MKLREFLEQLNALVAENPEAADMEAIYSIDDEGNAYHAVNWTGTLGHYKGEWRGDWTPEEHMNKEDMDDPDFDPADYPINSVCIN